MKTTHEKDFPIRKNLQLHQQTSITPTTTTATKRKNQNQTQPKRVIVFPLSSHKRQQKSKKGETI